jgi:hypothetical protein
MDVYVYVYVYSMFVVSCVGRGLAMSWSLIQGVLLTVLDKETEVKQKVSWMPHASVGAKKGGKNHAVWTSVHKIDVLMLMRVKAKVKYIVASNIPLTSPFCTRITRCHRSFCFSVFFFVFF